MNRYKLSLLIFAASAVASVAPLHWHKPSPPDLPQVRSHPNVIPALAAHHLVNDARAEDQALSWAERLLARLPDHLRRVGDPERIFAGESYFPILDRERAFGAITVRYGPSARAFLGIGTCEIRQGHYERAISAFSTARRLSPQSLGAATGFREATELLQVSRALRPLLSSDDIIIQMRPYPRPVHAQGWMILCAKNKPPDSELGRLSGPLTLRLVSRQGNRYRCLWTAVDRDSCASTWDDSVYDANVYVEDLAGQGVPQVIFHEQFACGDADPSHLAIYSWQHGKLQCVLNQQATTSFWLEDMAHNGTFQVWKGCSHLEHPQWTDVFAWRNGRFRLADWQFPAAFQHWVRDLQDSLGGPGGNSSLLAYLGATYDILGRHRDADRAFRAAERAFTHADKNSESLAQMARSYRAAGRIGRAEQYYRRAIDACRSNLPEARDAAIAKDLWVEMREAAEDVSGNWDN